MADFARSSDPGVQHQLDRLAALSPGGDVLGLERIARLLTRLGDPHRALPPVFHVAGTNGKGSTCAFLRAAFEAAGLRAHVYTSPHLVRFNERIRVAGRLIDDRALAALLGEVLDACGDAFEVGQGPSFFEVTTAAAFLAFARARADACVVEVGLGGRLDATNVVDAPAATGIAGLGIDHEAYLGSTLARIAAEKAGIAKAGTPLVTQAYPAAATDAVRAAAEAAGARWLPRGGEWDVETRDGGLAYRDRAGTLDLPLPRLAGGHQASNAALAVAMIRHQEAVCVPASALAAAVGRADWPARLQRLARGPLADRLPPGADAWLDGGHNPSAAEAVADFVRAEVPAERPLHIVCGLLANKDAAGVIAALAGRRATLHAVSVPGHASHAPAALAAIARAHGMDGRTAPDVAGALDAIRDAAPAVLIMGSLYLAGEVLRENGQEPT